MASKKNKSEKKEQKDRLKEIYLETIESGISLEDDLENLDYFKLQYKADHEKKLYTMFSCNLCMFKYKYQGHDSILIVFCVPSPSNSESKEDGRHISQKIMEIVKTVEESLITSDYMNLKEVKEIKLSCLTIVKKINEA